MPEDPRDLYGVGGLRVAFGRWPEVERTARRLKKQREAVEAERKANHESERAVYHKESGE